MIIFFEQFSRSVICDLRSNISSDQSIEIDCEEHLGILRSFLKVHRVESLLPLGESPINSIIIFLKRSSSFRNSFTRHDHMTKLNSKEISVFYTTIEIRQRDSKCIKKWNSELDRKIWRFKGLRMMMTRIGTSFTEDSYHRIVSTQVLLDRLCSRRGTDSCV